MKIAALQRITLLDYPGQLSCIVFTSSCNFRCPFCYSSELVLPEKTKELPLIHEEDFFAFLKERRGKLKGVVICGGEPTLHADLPDFCSKIKDLGYLIKLDTNGSNPSMLEELLKRRLVDYVALDIKASKEKYQTTVKASLENIAQKVEQSFKLLEKSQIDWEARTTLVPGIVDKEEIREIGLWLKTAPKYYLQSFLPQKTLDPAFEEIKPYKREEMEEMLEVASRFFPSCQLR